MPVPKNPSRRPADPRLDAFLAVLIWGITGLLIGAAIGIFTGKGIVFTTIGVVVGVAIGIMANRRRSIGKSEQHDN